MLFAGERVGELKDPAFARGYARAAVGGRIVALEGIGPEGCRDGQGNQTEGYPKRDKSGVSVIRDHLH